jgi:hypothetical protein
VGKAALRLPGLERRVHGLVARHGRLLALGQTQASQLALVALRLDGRVDRGYAPNGVASGPAVPGGVSRVGFAFERDGGAVFAIPKSGSSQRFEFAVARLDPDDEGQVKGGTVEPKSLPGRGPYSVAIRPGGDVLVLSFESEAPHRTWIARFRFGDNGGSTLWPGPGQLGPG